MDKVPMTPSGHRAMKDELARRKADRTKISQEIEVAREHGDLRENAEYHAAKEKQGLNEAHINDIEDKLSRAEVIDPSTLSGDRIKFGAHVTLADVESGKVVTYQIVGPDEADIERGLISVTSPVAKAMINREVGDEITVRAPAGLRTYEVQEITWDD